MRVVIFRAVSTCCIVAAMFATGLPALAQAPQKVSLRLDWTTLGYHTPFNLGIAKGHYKDAGLDVDVLEGKGSSTVITLVGNGGSMRSGVTLQDHDF
ncbi:MAG: ABC transporter substrate-binding protein [Casimicrobiaceae bacterium]